MAGVITDSALRRLRRRAGIWSAEEMAKTLGVTPYIVYAREQQGIYDVQEMSQWARILAPLLEMPTREVFRMILNANIPEDVK